MWTECIDSVRKGSRVQGPQHQGKLARFVHDNILDFCGSNSFTGCIQFIIIFICCHPYYMQNSMFSNDTIGAFVVQMAANKPSEEIDWMTLIQFSHSAVSNI